MLSPFPWEGCDPWRGRRHSPIQYLGVWGKNHFSGCLTPTCWCCCCSSVAEWCLTLHSPMGCRMPGHLFPFYLPWSDETRCHDLCLFVCLSLILGFKPAFSLSFFTLIKRFFSSSLLSAIRVVQFSSVAQSCPTLCDPMDWSTPGFPVLHQLPEIAQTHVHQVSDAIQPSHPLSTPPPPVFNLSQHQGLF